MERCCRYHDMERLSVLLALCEWIHQWLVDSPSQRASIVELGVLLVFLLLLFLLLLLLLLFLFFFFFLGGGISLSNLLNKQSSCWWFVIARCWYDVYLMVMMWIWFPERIVKVMLFIGVIPDAVHINNTFWCHVYVIFESSVWDTSFLRDAWIFLFNTLRAE